jgi:hypothetical protein
MRLKDLTPEQKLRILAELDGVNPEWVTAKYSLSLQDALSGNYLTSYDAIIPLIQRLDCDVVKRMALEIVDVSEDADYTFLRALNCSPSQLCDAVIVATGKAEL